MKKQIIRLTESDLHQIIRNTVHSILRENDMEERHVLKLHHDEPPMDEPPMDEPPMPPMDDAPDDGGMPPMDNGNEPPMDNTPDDGGMPPMDDGNEPPMDNEEPPMDDEPNGNNQEIDSIFDSLGIEDQSAVLKYAKSMADDSGNNGNDPNGMPMESRHYSNLDRIIEDVLGREVRGIDRTSKRQSKDRATDNSVASRPFRSER